MAWMSSIPFYYYCWSQLPVWPFRHSQADSPELNSQTGGSWHLSDLEDSDVLSTGGCILCCFSEAVTPPALAQPYLFIIDFCPFQPGRQMGSLLFCIRPWWADMMTAGLAMPYSAFPSSNSLTYHVCVLNVMSPFMSLLIYAKTWLSRHLNEMPYEGREERLSAIGNGQRRRAAQSQQWRREGEATQPEVTCD